MNNSFIPVNEPLLAGNEKKYLLKCIETGWISSEGPFIKKFEENLAQKVGRQHGIAVSSGTAALDIAVEALGIGSGDEVILPTFTIISCIQQIIRSGAKPVLVDSDPNTWNMDVGQIESKITSRTKAIMVVHTYGLPVDMEPVLSLANKYKIKIIEDAAEAHGQSYNGVSCGSFGDVSIFSFYPNKHITTGEGGMVLTDDDDLADQCRELRNLCFNAEKRFVHEKLGWNYRMSNLQAALGVAQLEKIEKSIVKKRWMGTLYSKLLKHLPGIQLPLSKTDYAENIYWIYGVVLDETISMNNTEFQNKLRQNGIGTRPFFWPMHEQPVLKKMGFFNEENYPVSERIARRGFYVPSGLAITENQILRVSNVLEEVLL
jgi:perosamine synthetase